MKRSTLTVVGAVALLATVFAAGGMKSAMQAKYNKACVAIRSGNIEKMEKSLMSMSTKDFKMIDASGKETSGEESMKEMKQQMAGIKRVNSCNYTVTKVSVKGNMATVWTNYSMSATLKPDEHKKTHHMRITGKGEDTWVKEGKDWKMSVMKALKETMTMDGKPMQTGGH